MKEPSELLEILGRYVDGVASRTEIAELNAVLRDDADLRRTYRRYMNIDSALASRSQPSVTPAAGRVRGVRAGLAIAAVLAVAVGVLLWRGGRSVGESGPSFATLVAVEEAVWGDPNLELALNSGQLPVGMVQLDSGVAEFLMRDGATVVLRGPVGVRFLEAKRIFVEHGQLFCRCPSPESRIAVETPVTEIVDLGTEFAVEARSDRSTRVAVLSGEVQVGKSELRNLRKGEAAEVRADGILIVRPFARAEFADLLRLAPHVGEAMRSGMNELRDPGFELSFNPMAWNGTEANIATGAGGRVGNAVRVFARGEAPWPQCRQKIPTGDIGGKLLVASVWAAPAADDPLRSRQFAILKLAFVNEQGREFAYTKRHLLTSQPQPGRFEFVELATIAPPGTKSVQFQLVLHAHTHGRGSVLFDDASLVITDAPSVP